MNAVELLAPDGIGNHKPSGVWMCQKCRGLYCPRACTDPSARAEKCCAPPTCGTCGASLRDTYRYSSECGPCGLTRRRKADAEQLAKATKLDTWDGWVYWDGHGSNNGFFSSLADLLEHLHGGDIDPADWPEYVHVCEPERFEVSCQSICERETEEMHDGAAEELQGVEEFEEACREFTRANAHVVSWWEDVRRAVRVPRPGELFEEDERS